MTIKVLQCVLVLCMVLFMETDLKKREKRVTVLLTPNEQARIAAAAASAGLGISAYIRLKMLEAVNA